ncbi:MAG TPA: COX15/CtaA family protein [Chloroflexota bacterium]|nr:COX15/CtaA family protein [Chloroflexota bacterium]
MYRILKWLSVVSACGMFVVLVMGALVTNTGSAQGCGGSWPLCKGQFIPEMAFQTLVEFSHRAVTGAETVLVLALAAGTVLLYRQRREAQVLVPLMIVFLFLQALLGGLAVMFPASPEVLALHFGISLISFASVVLTAAFIMGLQGGEAVRDRPVSRGLRRLVWAALAYTYVVVYLGAYVRHAGASLACLDWPSCNGALFPAVQGAVGVQVIHRWAAGVLVLLLFGLWLQARRDRALRPDLYRAGTTAFALALVQALSGGLVVLSRLELFTLLLHAALVALLFASLCYMAYQLIPQCICLPRRAPTAPAGAVRAGVK